ncbi:MAG: helix-turn-helix domain-containing protein [Campylobacteraceae bacterium]|jgi:excisionase family DNA binding protein|nr:helix-turn-helix domain-containing protein [Campylobacteraceae bacterium]
MHQNKSIEGKNGLSPREASRYLGLSVPTLQRLKREGLSPAYIKIGEKNSKVIYPIKELDKWLEKNLKKVAV